MVNHKEQLIGCSFFVVLFQGRSGSSWLIEALASHPQIEVIGEKLASLHPKGAIVQNQWLQGYFSEHAGEDSIHGFKTKLTDIIDLNEFSNQLILNHCSIIWLDRSNLVKQALSWLRADDMYERFGVHNIYDIKYQLPTKQIDCEELLKRTVSLDRGKKQLTCFIDGLKLPCLHIFYEDLLLDTNVVFKLTQEFLRVKTCNLTSSIVKATPDSLSDAISNFSEVEDVFRGTVYSNMLSEAFNFK